MKFKSLITIAFLALFTFASAEEIVKYDKNNLPENARLITFDDVYSKRLQRNIKRDLEEDGVPVTMIDQLKSEVEADSNFVCVYFWSSVSDAQDVAYFSGRITGAVVISEYATGKYWQTLKSASRSFASLQQLLEAKEEAELENYKLELSQEQIDAIKNLDDASKRELAKASAYKEITRRANVKIYGNLAGMLVNATQLMQNKWNLVRPTVIRAIRASVKNMKAAKDAKEGLDRNQEMLEIVETALEEAGIDFSEYL